MKQFQEDFVNFLYKTGALKFGNFTLKSGRESPFFVNLGDFNKNHDMCVLANYYALAILETYGDDFNVIFGPAYKGIPLAVGTAMILNMKYGYKNIAYCSNRKEIKDHGDTGILLGHKLKEGDRVVIIEDVITSGKSMEETVPILQANKVEIVGSMVSLDRHEIGKGGTVTALKEVSNLYGFPTAAIVSMPEAAEYLRGQGKITDEQCAAIDEYYKKYGPKEE